MNTEGNYFALILSKNFKSLLSHADVGKVLKWKTIHFMLRWFKILIANWVSLNNFDKY